MSDQNNSPLDHSHLAEMTGGDEDFRRELIGDFLSFVPGELDRLSAGVADSDPTTVREAAHALKGSGRSIGATPLADACAEMEQAALAGELGQAPELLTRIKSRFTEFSAFVSE